MKKAPFVTLVLFSYNQQSFIKDAAISVLHQDCEPIEIIFSDDCSTDKTYSILVETAMVYTGPHEVITRRNDRNLGLIDHINKVFQIAKGQWIIVAAGDDISAPNRVKEINNAITKHPQINMVSSALIDIDKYEEKKDIDSLFMGEKKTTRQEVVITGLRELIANEAPYVHGATLAYSKKLINAFPPLPSNAVYEDAIFRIRSALIGTKAHINKPLVLYRINPNQTTNISQKISRDLFNKTKKLETGSYITARQTLSDLEISTSIDQSSYKNLKEILESELNKNKKKWRLIAWIWPFRLAYLLFLLIASPKIIMQLRKNNIAFALLPKIALPMLSKIVRKK